MVLIKTLNSLLTNKSLNQIHKTLKSLTNIKYYNKVKLLNNLQFNLLKDKVLENSINYVLRIEFSKTNTLINVSNIKGHSLILLTSGHIDLTKKQKKSQPVAVINLLKNIIFKSAFLNNKTIALHFKNIKPYYENLIIKLLKNIIFLKVLKSSNLHPHNGCRPTKKKRFKQRTKKY